jgi:hypothetical protein
MNSRFTWNAARVPSRAGRAWRSRCENEVRRSRHASRPRVDAGVRGGAVPRSGTTRSATRRTDPSTANAGSGRGPGARPTGCPARTGVAVPNAPVSAVARRETVNIAESGGATPERSCPRRRCFTWNGLHGARRRCAAALPGSPRCGRPLPAAALTEPRPTRRSRRRSTCPRAPGRGRAFRLTDAGGGPLPCRLRHGHLCAVCRLGTPVHHFGDLSRGARTHVRAMSVLRPNLLGYRHAGRDEQ